MPSPPETADLQAWHRHFAMEANNRAWQLASQPTRSELEADEMLDAAHASAHHWNRCGTDLNRMRASYLLAEVHALLGFGASAMTRAAAVLEYFERVEAPDWERAYVRVIHAHAAAAVGDAPTHAEAYALAETAIHGIADPEDRRIVEQTFAQVPRPTP